MILFFHGFCILHVSSFQQFINIKQSTSFGNFILINLRRWFQYNFTVRFYLESTSIFGLCCILLSLGITVELSTHSLNDNKYTGAKKVYKIYFVYFIKIHVGGRIWY